MVTPLRLLARLALSTIGVVAAIYAAVCVYLWSQQRALIFLPERVVRHTPTEFGLPYEEVTIPIGDGDVLYGWWLPSRLTPSTPVTVLYLRGNDGNLGTELPRLQALHLHGLPILAIDYRGYGRSSGPAPSEAQVYDDATAAWDYLVRDKGIPAGQIILYGHSLGSAVAAELALRRGNACALVLEGAFTSMADMARLEYPLIPAEWLLNQRFDTAGKLARLRLPILLVHGSADTVVPASMSRQLQESSGGRPALLFIEAAGHEEALSANGRQLQQALAQLAQHCDRLR